MDEAKGGHDTIQYIHIIRKKGTLTHIYIYIYIYIYMFVCVCVCI